MAIKSILNFKAKGFATEAVKASLEIGFNQIEFHRIEAGCEQSNKASIKVAKRVGLIREGVRKKFFPQDGGLDMVFFAQNAFDFNI